MTQRICSISDCESIHYGRGWCKKHWTRFWQHGSPDVILTNGGALVAHEAEVLARFEAGETQSELAKAYGVTPGSVGEFLRTRNVAPHLSYYKQLSNPLTDTDAAYLAGIIDGEGCIFGALRSSRSEVRGGITISNCAGSVLDWTAEITGVGTVYWQTVNGGWGSTRIGCWRVGLHQGADLLAQLLPYLKIKHQEALWLIEMAQLRRLDPERSVELVRLLKGAKKNRS